MNDTDMTHESASARLLDKAQQVWRDRFGSAPVAAAYAPGRVEILGNHTDYNEGWALAAAIDCGTVFLAAPSHGPSCRLYAGDLDDEACFDINAITPSATQPWSNYIRGMLHWLQSIAPTHIGFNAVFTGSIPVGAGLSSSASLEMASGLALAHLYGIPVQRQDLAKAGQTAEHDFAGARCGLLDQLSSLHGQRHALVLIDFRTLAVRTIPLRKELRLLIADTRVKHALVDGAYNERRAACEAARTAFADVLPRPIRALRDVTWEEWQTHASAFDPTMMRRAAHVIGENKRVIEGATLLEHGDAKGFGKLMFDSHASSINNFENSCPEQDVLVAKAKALPGVLGARLSGGGFGGSVVVLVEACDAERTGQALTRAFAEHYGAPCPVLTANPADGACLLTP